MEKYLQSARTVARTFPNYYATLALPVLEGQCPTLVVRNIHDPTLKHEMICQEGTFDLNFEYMLGRLRACSGGSMDRLPLPQGVATSIDKINKLLALANQDTEEGRTAAVLAVKQIREGGYTITHPTSSTTTSSSGVAANMGIPNKDKIDLIFPAVVEGGLLLMAKGLRATKEGMVDVYERAMKDKLDYPTRVCLLSRLHAKFLKFKQEGYIVTFRGGGGGYELAPGVEYKNGKFCLWAGMAMIALIKVPHDIARLLSEVPVEGDAEAEGDDHITLVYFEDNLSTDQMFKAAQVIYEAASQVYGPIQIAVNQITSFPADPSGKIPIIARVTSPVLELLRLKIATALDTHGIPYSKRHPEFKPHVTLAYTQGATPPPDLSIPTLQWGCAELFLWGGAWGDHSFSVCYPISAPPTEAAISAVYRQALVAVIQNNSLPLGYPSVPYERTHRLSNRQVFRFVGKQEDSQLQTFSSASPP